MFNFEIYAKNAQMQKCKKMLFQFQNSCKKWHAKNYLKSGKWAEKNVKKHANTEKGECKTGRWGVYFLNFTYYATSDPI